jgi:hypothetical protein
MVYNTWRRSRLVALLEIVLDAPKELVSELAGGKPNQL